LSDFGLKIGIEGEKQFKDALRDINQAFKVLGSETNPLVSYRLAKCREAPFFGLFFNFSVWYRTALFCPFS